MSASVQGIKTVLYPVSDVEKAKVVYTALVGIAPQADSSYYVGYDVAGQHIGLLPGGGPQGLTSPVAAWHRDELEGKHPIAGMGWYRAAKRNFADLPED